MSATTVRPADTVAIGVPVPLVPGEHGADSPAAEPGIPRYRWYAWIELAADREAGRPSPLPVVEWALGHRALGPWPGWWLADTPTGGWLAHAAQIDDVDGGGAMLLAQCLRSAPWSDAVAGRVVSRNVVDLGPDIARCPDCAAAGS